MTCFKTAAPFGAAILAVFVATPALAQIPSAAGVYTACVHLDKDSDEAKVGRLIDPALEKCRKGESTVTWNAQGQKGDQGVQGPQGLPGPAGPAGPQASTGAQVPKVDPGATGAQGPVGATAQGPRWHGARQAQPPGRRARRATQARWGAGPKVAHRRDRGAGPKGTPAQPARRVCRLPRARAARASGQRNDRGPVAAVEWQQLGRHAADSRGATTNSMRPFDRQLHHAAQGIYPSRNGQTVPRGDRAVRRKFPTFWMVYV